MEKHSNKDYIAFFDLDHTILNTSSGKIIGLAAIKHGVVKKTKLIEGAIFAIGNKLGLLDGDTILPRMVKWLKGHPEQFIVDFARQIFNDIMKQAIRMDAIKEIEYHKRNNAHTVLLSASLSFICRPVFEFLGIDDIICTDLLVENNRFSGYPKGRLCFGKEKLERSLSYIKNKNFDLKNAFFYTDSISDLPMLEAVGNPICVTPDRKLSATARDRGWKICRW